MQDDQFLASHGRGDDVLVQHLNHTLGLLGLGLGDDVLVQASQSCTWPVRVRVSVGVRVRLGLGV